MEVAPQKTPVGEMEEKILELRNSIGDLGKQPLFDEDFYLARFLRARGMDVQKAEKYLRKSTKWRRDNNINALLNKPFPDDLESFPVYCNAVTHDGVIAVTIDAGNIDLRALLSQVGKEGAVTLLTQALVQSEQCVVASNRKKFGKNPIQEDSLEGGIVLVTFEGFNPWQTSSPTAIQVIYECCKIFVKHFPYLVSAVYCINCSSASAFILKYVKSLLEGPHLKIHVFSDKEEHVWKSELLSRIPVSRLPHYFGGTIMKMPKRDGFVEEAFLRSVSLD